MPMTLGDVLTEARDLLDEPTAAQWSQQQLRRWANGAVRDISRRAECLLASTSIAVVAGTQQYNGPSDAIRLHMVKFKPSGDNQQYDLKYMDYRNVSNVAWTQEGITQSIPAIYWTWGAPPNLKVNLYPIPAVSGTINVFYYRSGTQLATDGSADGSNVDVPSGWEDLVVEYVVYRAKLKDNDPTWREAKEEYEQHLDALMGAAIRYNDQAGMMVSQFGSFVPAWLYAGEEW